MGVPLRVGLSAISFSAALQKDAAPIPNAEGWKFIASPFVDADMLDYVELHPKVWTKNFWGHFKLFSFQKKKYYISNVKFGLR